ncbi:MAG: RDD family protein [Longimicrobiales bacterium]|nr:RDD family protein [Longimicrobiales bacterium]
MPTPPITAQIQGVARDLSCANGSYDAVDLGTVTPDRLAELLATMTLLAPPEGDGDLCWPNLIVTGPLGDAAFSLADESGGLVTAEGADVTDLGEAVASVTGVPFTGVIPAHRRGVAPAAAAKAHPLRKTPKGAQPSRERRPGPRPRESHIEQKAKELMELLQHPVRLKEYRARYPYLLAGPDDPEFRRLCSQIQATDLMPELKAMLQNLAPREWALIHPGLGRRFFAFVIDLLLFVVFLFIGLAVAVEVTKGSSQEALGIAGLIWMVVAYFVYFAGTELLFSASPGGLATGLRVVNERGGRPSLWLCLGRQFSRIFRMFGAVATVLLFSKARTVNARMAGGGMAARIGASGGGEVVRA